MIYVYGELDDILCQEQKQEQEQDSRTDKEIFESLLGFEITQEKFEQLMFQAKIDSIEMNKLSEF